MNRNSFYIKFSIGLIILTLCSSLSSFSQDIIHIDIPWTPSKNITFNEESLLAPSISSQSYNGVKPNFSWKEKTKKGINCSLHNYTSENATPEDIKFLSRFNIEVPKTIDYKIKVTNGSNDHFISLNLFPFVNEDKVIKRITSVEISKKSESVNPPIKPKSISNSVLAEGSGYWYKISVAQDGIYKIDKQFLEECGINTSQLDPNSIHIYGNGEGKLPELNSVPRTDDLANNALLVSGGNDGVFNDNDYILFYGWGPTRWYKNSSNTNFYHDQNIYSDYSYYFININPNIAPVRISSIPSSTSSPNQTVNSYSYFTNYEKDLKSLVNGGQRWYGELFDTDLQQTFQFNIPDIDNTTPVNFDVNLASNSSSSSGTSQSYSINNTTIASSTLPSGFDADSYGRSSLSFQYPSPQSSFSLKISITRSNPSTLTYLDNILINCRRKLSFTSDQFNFRDLSSVGSGNISLFSITNVTPATFVWDITDKQTPFNISGTFNSSTYSFTLETDTLREFVVSNGTNFLTPGKSGSIAYQNLHGLEQADYIIVTHKDFTDQANRLAELHKSIGTSVHVVTSEQVFNEFSSGMPDPTAIKRFVKMFYDRGYLNPETRPKHLLLFGDGTYDPKNRVANNNNYILTYQALNSENHISALVSDDYFGLLDDNDSFDDVDLLDIGVGRLLISDNTMAKQQVDKIEHYMKNGSSLFGTGNSCCNSSGSNNSTFGDWRQKYVLIADDEQGGLFVDSDAEPNYAYVKTHFSSLNADKIYLDAYQQITTAGGQRYPDVYNAITDRVQNGALVINYIGHGGEVGVAEERVITIPQIESWNNINRMNLLVSATCEFTKFDDPDRVSAGEIASLNENGASIALMTTTRSIYISINSDLIDQFYKNVFSRDADSLPLTFGEIMTRTKNQASASDNKRCFTLIGDPALRLALPKMKIVTDSINGSSPSIETDTIRALSKVTIKGHIENYNNQILTDFNGTLSPTFFDKPKEFSTLGQDPNSPILPFELQKNAIFKGQATVKNGYFEFSFIVPKDINYTYGNGKISYYADNRGSTNQYDAGGNDSRVIIGGIDPNGIQDSEAPTIDIYLNDQNFADGGLTDETPVLYAILEDESGINTVGNGIGHDITVILDGETSNPIVLNSYYTADIDSYQKGKIEYSFPPIAVGEHSLTLKAWDINNNSSEATIRFQVKQKDSIALSHVLNYPNPFTTHTEFYFEHNQVCNSLEAQIQIFTVSGRLVKTIQKTVISNGFRSNGISWDGKDDFGDQLAKGVYIYKMSVKNSEGEIAEKIEKLVLLK